MKETQRTAVTDVQTTLCPFCMKMVQSEICPNCGRNVNYAGHPTHLPVGYTLIGHGTYVLGAALGQGGFGITYIALNAATSLPVAIKEYYPNHCCARDISTAVIPSYGQEETFSKGKEHFLLEAQMLQSLSDLQSVVKVLDYFEANNSAYLVMEYLDGSSLKDYVERSGKLPAQAFLKQMQPLMADMEKMHQRGVVHRDIAPDNIIMLSDGRLKLIDFGAARSYVGDKSMTVVVKKGFAPVEQYMRKGSNASTDVYALAATIYYCVTGIVPPDSAERQYGEATLQAPTALGILLSREQERGLEKALEIQPKARTQSVAELAKALEQAPKPVKPKAEKNNTSPQSKQAKPVQTEPKKKAKWWIPVAAALVLCVGAGMLFMGKEKTPVSEPVIQLEATQIQSAETQPARIFTAEEQAYNEAVDLFNNGEYGKAAIAFGKLGDYRDAKEISFQIWNAIANRETFSTSGSHIVGIKNNGTVISTGSNNYGQCNVDDWTDIIAVSTGPDHTIGLRSDGTVVAAGMGGSDWTKVSEWTDIVSVHTGYLLTVGIKSDGSIVTTASDNMLDSAHYLDWTDAVTLDFSFWWGSTNSVVGIKLDGTSYSYPDIGTLSDIIDISTESGLTAAVKSDGTVLTFNDNSRPWNQLKSDDINEWNSIVDVEIGADHILGLKSNGTVVASGDNSNKEKNVEDWSDIVAICAGNSYSVGLKSDDTAVITGSTKNNLGSVSKWNDIRLPNDRDALLAAIELDYVTE